MINIDQLGIIFRKVAKITNLRPISNFTIQSYSGNQIIIHIYFIKIMHFLDITKDNKVV